MSLIFLALLTLASQEAPPVPAVRTQSAPPVERARPRRNLSLYVRNGDYPPGALRRYEQGVVGFDLDVSAEGRVTDCRVTASSGSEDLDLATCRIMRRRARFDPARDAQGNRVPDRHSSRLAWQLSG